MIHSAQRALLTAPVMKTAHIGISIFDTEKEQYLFNYQGDKYFVPASNIKIPSCYAALKYLGDSLPALQYVLLNADTILIAGTGSPDLLHPDFSNQPVLEFLTQFKHIKLAIQPFTDFLGNGWAWNDYTEYYMAQRSALPIYGNIARFNWKSEDELTIIPSFFQRNISVNNALKNGFALEKSWDNNSFTLKDGSEKDSETPFRPDAVTIQSLLQDTLKTTVTIDTTTTTGFKTLYSRPINDVLKPMMHRSDNFFAEQMLLMVSQQKLGTMNDAEIIDTLLKTDLADLPQRPRWVDGSGLSRYNLFTPQDFVAILNKMQKEFGMARMKQIFPTGGEGTISSYYKVDSSYIYAKTGTLSGVVSLSGFLYTAKGKLLIFSVLVNNHNGSAIDVRRAVEKFIQSIRDLKS